jgi:hypothetical protein
MSHGCSGGLGFERCRCECHNGNGCCFVACCGACEKCGMTRIPKESLHVHKAECTGTGKSTDLLEILNGMNFDQSDMFVCKCHCHTHSGVRHMAPCCMGCQKCGMNMIPVHVLDLHESKCPGRPIKEHPEKKVKKKRRRHGPKK